MKSALQRWTGRVKGRTARVTLSNLSVGGKNVFYLAQCREAAARQGCA